MQKSDIEIVQSSFSQVEHLAAEIADEFYERLFEIDPGLRSMFSGDMVEQKKALIGMLGAVIKGLDSAEQILPSVQKLGIRHLRYHVQASHYDTVGQALILTLRSKYGRNWNEQMERSWKAAYTLLSSEMKEAAKKHLKKDAVTSSFDFT